MTYTSFTADCDHIYQTIKQMRKPSSFAVLALSGGPDSMFLLYILKKYVEHFHVPTEQLIICSVDHATRPETAQEVEFLRRYCKEFTFVTERYTGEEQTEKAWRTRRHGVLTQTCKTYNANLLFFGHHADDRVETILLHMRRGAKQRGRNAMSVLQSHWMDDSISVGRPLISLTKKTIMKYVKDLQLPYFYDISNDDSSVSQRNYLRNEILPWLLYDGDRPTKFRDSFLQMLEVACESSLNNAGNVDTRDRCYTDILPYETHRWTGSPKQNIQYEDIQTMRQNMGSNNVQASVKDIQALHQFVLESSHGYRYVDGINWVVAHGQIYAIKAPEAFWKTTRPTLQKSIIIEQRDVDQKQCDFADENFRLPPHAKQGMLLRYPQKGDIYLAPSGSKKRNKRCINQKIPIFVRSYIPVLVTYDQNIVYARW